MYVCNQVRLLHEKGTAAIDKSGPVCVCGKQTRGKVALRKLDTCRLRAIDPKVPCVAVDAVIDIEHTYEQRGFRFQLTDLLSLPIS
ncbi:hypothetical protein EOD39_0888 [Acipenser ruthenus]|uniref:Uncharacterized protein n=1 Tax=Acipenser ruthenus TaxID=7906 RepID=A0A444UKV9_ACIRT|nr:hypothetical protein EOD39_0888 [Acipenser ruthenus]